MKIVEFIVAGIFAAAGLRSFVHWVRRPFDSSDVADHLLYAVYLTGRIGTWFAFAGISALYGAAESEDRTLTAGASQFRWFAVLFGVLIAMQLIGGQFLGRRSPKS